MLRNQVSVGILSIFDCCTGQSMQVKMLIDAKADMFIASSDGMMPIHRAAAEGHMEVLEELISQGKYLIKFL